MLLFGNLKLCRFNYHRKSSGYFLRLTQKRNNSEKRKYLEQNENENTIFQNIWEGTKEII